eukprot:6183059-Pleurochrysis_carterae.AAC.1
MVAACPQRKAALKKRWRDSSHATPVARGHPSAASMRVGASAQSGASSATGRSTCWRPSTSSSRGRPRTS